MECKDIAWS
jgi:hypothetical protein